jgi:outer membrane protein assembly factor BamD (BamD/ComL family)
MAQETIDHTASLSTGERLRRVEELLEVPRTQKGPDDTKLLLKVEADLKRMLETDPSSVFKSQIEADLDFVNEGLAHHDLVIASFYMERGHGLRGASARLQHITQRYPKFSKMDEVLFRLIKVSMAYGQEEDAIRYCWSLICNYPNSEYVKQAFEQLNVMGVSSWEGCQKYKR